MPGTTTLGTLAMPKHYQLPSTESIIVYCVPGTRIRSTNPDENGQNPSTRLGEV